MSTGETPLPPSSSQPTAFNIFSAQGLIERPLPLLLARIGFVVIFIVTVAMLLISAPLAYESSLGLARNDPAFSRAIATLNWDIETVTLSHIVFQRLVVLPLVLLALLIFYHRSRSWLPLLTAVYLIMALPTLTSGLASLAELSAVWRWVVAVYFYVYTCLSIYWLLVFPDGRFFVRRTRWLLPFVGLWNIYITHTFILSGQPLTLAGIWPTLLFVAIGLWALLYRSRNGPQHQRRQIKWVRRGVVYWLGVLLLHLVGVALLPLLRDVQQPPLLLFGVLLALMIYALPSVSVTIVGLAIGTSVIRANLYGITLAVNRSLVFGSVAALLGIAFAVATFVLQAVFGANYGVLLAALGAGIAYNPLRLRIQRLIDRKFFGFRFDLTQLKQSQKTLATPKPAQGFYTSTDIGQYHLGEMLGGGMAEVYLAHQNDKIYALKLMNPGWYQEEKEQQTARLRFQREQQMLAKLNHRNIVRAYRWGVVDDIQYIVMEYIEGQTLRSYIKQRGRLELQEALRIFEALASALDHAHECGIIHRDVKPANVMLRQLESGQGEAMLMDFGIARNEATALDISTGGPLGTIEYMAPEQIVESQNVTRQADIYALGIVLYEMLTGERPFKGNAASVMFAHLHKNPPDPRDIRPDIPQHIAFAILRALSKDASDRYASTHAMAGYIFNLR
jgi:tRNA A-37 threonylcarbamoyl transferase component Bud32